MNKVIVQLPQYLYYPTTQGETFTPTCFINTQQLSTCTVVLSNENNDSNMPENIASIYLSLDATAINTINTDKTFDLKISGMRNYYEIFAPTDSMKMIVSTASTAGNNVLDSVTFSLTGKDIEPNSAIAWNSVTLARDTAKLDTASVATFTLKSDSIFKPNQKVYLKIPKSQLKPISVEPTCKFSVQGTKTAETCSIVTQDVTQFTVQVQNSKVSFCTDNTKTGYCDIGSVLTIELSSIINAGEVPDFSQTKNFELALMNN